ncbi:MAG: DNA polymerase III subunit epsilon, partial [Deltaproteobacteria bacterium]|nr:DNA polymerase III subunit epsilon [Deltaproteobacteria bacterium]
MFRYGLSEDGKTFQAHKFEGLTPAPGKLEPTKDSVLVVVLDLETTGLNNEVDEVIEVGARKILLDKKTGALLSVGEAFSELGAAKEPLSPIVKTITGLTDSDIVGKTIDWDRFDEFLSGAALIIAHNAAFDRPFVDKKSRVSNSQIWACSSFHVKWQTWFSSCKLELLCL